MFPNASLNTWIPTLQPVYNSVSNLVICPITDIQKPPPMTDTAGTYNKAWFKALNINPMYYNGSYCINGYLYANDAHGDAASFNRDVKAKYPTQTPVFLDGAWCDCWPSTNDTITNPLNLQNPWPNTSAAGFQRLLVARHGPHRVNNPPTSLSFGRTPTFPGGTQIVFLDGHVEAQPLINLWQLYWHPDWMVLPPK
jgi:prepilin-type processing-associated H-X9-DG protein